MMTAVMKAHGEPNIVEVPVANFRKASMLAVYMYRGFLSQIQLGRLHQFTDWVKGSDFGIFTVCGSGYFFSAFLILRTDPRILVLRATITHIEAPTIHMRFAIVWAYE